MLRLLRPHQWIKSSFVFVGLLFGHVWSDWALVVSVVQAAVAFSFAASAIYVMNAFVDRERDRLHPEKCRRPLASGAVSETQARWLGGGCLVLAIGFALLSSGQVALIVMAYLGLNVA